MKIIKVAYRTKTIQIVNIKRQWIIKYKNSIIKKTAQDNKDQNEIKSQKRLIRK